MGENYNKQRVGAKPKAFAILDFPVYPIYSWLENTHFFHRKLRGKNPKTFFILVETYSEKR